MAAHRKNDIVHRNGKTQEVIETLLGNRGIKTKKQKEEFFNPPDPKKLSTEDFGVSSQELKKAVVRIKEAIAKKEKIIVYGDYDVDGLCATAILWETLDALRARAMPYIPSRFTEGYGLNEESIKELAKDEEVKLVLTVDQGIVATKQIETANSLGLDVIITDHHQPGDTIPNAFAVVHTTKVSGSAVAWVLARELAKDLKLKFPQDHLALVTLGTITDILPLIGINRSLVAHGLQILRMSPRLGIRGLCREAAVIQDNLDTYHIGFVLGPRLNAMGRVDHAMESLRLLCTRSAQKASELAIKLGHSNRQRQEKTEAVVSHVNSHYDPVWSEGNIPKLLYVHHAGYDEGVVGVAAGRLVDKYHRPAIVLSVGEEYAKASARSIPGVNIVDLLKNAGDGLFKNIGGHPMAAGFTIKTHDVELLGQRLLEVSELDISDEVLIKNTRVDCKIQFSDVTNALFEELAKFEPFGFGNPEPTFKTKGVCVDGIRLVGKEKNHLKLVLSQQADTLTLQRAVFNAIGFRMEEWYPKLSPESSIGIVYAVEMDTWNGNKSLQLKIKQIYT